MYRSLTLVAQNYPIPLPLPLPITITITITLTFTLTLVAQNNHYFILLVTHLAGDPHLERLHLSSHIAVRCAGCV